MKKIAFTICIQFMIVLAIATPTFSILQPSTAMAQTITPDGDDALVQGGIATVAAGATCLVNIVGGLLNDFIATYLPFLGGGPVVPVNDETMNFRECVLDPLAWLAANIIIDQITEAIVLWIQDGFEGAPMFVTDFRGFMIDTADVAFGEFVLGAGLEELCSEFKLDLQIVMTIAHFTPTRNKWQCRLSDIVGNIDEFFSGVFADGGWVAWHEITYSTTQDPLKAWLNAINQSHLEMEASTQEFTSIIEWGRGWLSKLGVDTGAIEVPGQVIEDSVNEALGAGKHRLTIADDVNEIVSAIFAFLLQDILLGSSNSNGLLGAGNFIRQNNAPQIAFQNLLDQIITDIDAGIAIAQAAGITAAVQQLQQLRAQALAIDPNSPNAFAQLQQIRAQVIIILGQLNGNAGGNGGPIFGPGGTPLPPVGPPSGGGNPGGTPIPGAPTTPPIGLPGQPGTTPTASGGGTVTPPPPPPPPLI